MTKHKGLGGVYNRNVFSQSSGTWKSKIRVPAWSWSSEGLPGLKTVSLSSHGGRGQRERELWCLFL